jgi:hypothetical protein
MSEGVCRQSAFLYDGMGHYNILLYICGHCENIFVFDGLHEDN